MYSRIEQPFTYEKTTFPGLFVGGCLAGVLRAKAIEKALGRPIGQDDPRATARARNQPENKGRQEKGPLLKAENPRRGTSGSEGKKN